MFVKPLIIAHRGDTINYPENTIEAFSSAFKRGAGGIEFDLHLDKKGNVIVVHNYLFDENKKYPLFKDVLKLFGQKGRLEIEIKSLDPKCIIKVSELIEIYKPKNFEITSSILPLFPYIKGEFPKAKIGLIFKESLIESWMTKDFIKEFVLSFMKLTGANVLHLPFEYYTPNIVKLMHANGFLSHAYLKSWGVDKFRKAEKLGIDQCTTDDINLLKKI